jgi:hypothetical protein
MQAEFEDYLLFYTAPPSPIPSQPGAADFKSRFNISLADTFAAALA